MDYDDFEIRIFPADRSPPAAEGSTRLALRVECSAGEDLVEIAPGIGPDDAEELLETLRRASARPGRPGAERGDRGPGTVFDDPQAVGRTLSRLLFPAEVLPLWSRSRALAESAGKGLRLRLHVDLRRPELAWLGTLPWELLHDPERDQAGDGSSRGPLALDGCTSIVRYLDMRRDRRPFPEARPWRVLVVAPRRWGIAEPAVEQEREELLATWGDDDRVELVFPERATFDGIRRELTRRRIHAVHFMGHGVFEESTGWGGLVLESTSGRELPVTGPNVGALVRGVEPPALVVLNACDGGRSGVAGGAHAFAGAAAALMEAGVPAVVAMQLPIAQGEAVHCSKVLYQRLQDGHPVDRAVAEARLSLEQSFSGRLSWAIPALFLRVPDGRLFAEGDDDRRAPTPEGVRSRGDTPAATEEAVFDAEYGEVEGSTIEEVGYDLEGTDSATPEQRRAKLGGKFGKVKNATVTRTGFRRRN